LYDLENPRGRDTDFYVDLATELDARTIVDLGCGTGLLTCELAVDGRRVIGVDPSSAMLREAARRQNAGAVKWVEGDATALGEAGADLVVMTGNVAQVFLDDADWMATLSAAKAALRPGGRLAFECRNPDDQPWRRWTRRASYHEIDSPYGLIQAWLEVTRVVNGRVRFEHYYVFTDTGDVVTAGSELRFRGLPDLTHTLEKAGFSVEHVYGGWGSEPFDAASRVMIVIARRS
jgi:SAM-dependent methyltransferase